MTVTHALGETADGGSRVPVTDAAREALVRARDHLLSLQHELGWWQGSWRPTSPWTPRTC